MPPVDRRHLNPAAQGSPAGACAFVIQAQPYQRDPDTHRHAFAIISACDNADKHCSLVTIGSGLQRTQSSVMVHRNWLSWNLTPFYNDFVKDSAEVARFYYYVPTLPHFGEAEVDVEASGIPAVAAQVPHLGGSETLSGFGTWGARLIMIGAVRDVLCAFESVVGPERFQSAAFTQTC